MVTQRLRRNQRTLYVALAACAGCMGPLFRPQSPQTVDEVADASAKDARLIGSITHPYGLGFMKVENVALVTGLGGSGEDPPPSPQRAALLADMNRREIEDPNEVLASTDTGLVVVRGFLRPGIQVGERFDVELRSPGRSDTTSLRGGVLLETALTETAVLGNS
ncbi:MAG: flagellar basal body P-ring protein FlgI, partial [Planctomycetota bacterium]